MIRPLKDKMQASTTANLPRSVILATTANERGGVWRHILDLSNGLLLNGYVVTVATPPSEVLQTDLRERGVAWISLAASLRADAATWHLHAHNTFDLSVPGLLAKRKLWNRTSKIVFTEHLPRVAAADAAMEWDPTVPPGRKKPGAKYAKTLIKWFEFACADAVVAVSEGSAAFLKKRYRRIPTQLSVVPNGVPLGPEPSAPPGNTPMEIVCLGALGWRKGFDVLIAAAKLAKQPWHATVVGEGALKEVLEAEASTLTNAKIEFIGYVSGASKLYETADVACMPSRSESSPYAALEAMMAGRALVGTRVEGLSEFIIDGTTGLLIPPDDAQALADALDQLSLDVDTRASMGKAAYQRAKANYTLDAMVQRTIAVYEGVNS